MLAAISRSLLVGATMLNVFTWRVFRPSERWGAALFGFLVAGLVPGHGGGALAALGPLGPLGGMFLWTGIAFRIAVYAWAVAEAPSGAHSKSRPRWSCVCATSVGARDELSGGGHPHPPAPRIRGPSQASGA